MEGKTSNTAGPKTLTGSSQNAPSLKRQPGRWFLEEGPLRVKTKHEDRFRPFRSEISNANANAFMQMSVFEPLIYIQRYSCDRHGPFLHVFHGSVFYVHLDAPVTAKARADPKRTSCGLEVIARVALLHFGAFGVIDDTDDSRNR